MVILKCKQVEQAFKNRVKKTESRIQVDFKNMRITKMAFLVAVRVRTQFYHHLVDRHCAR